MYALSTNINEARFQINAICKNELSQRPFSAKFELLTQDYKVESQRVFVRRLNQIIFVKDQLKELVKTEDVKEICLILEDLEPQKAPCPQCSHVQDCCQRVYQCNRCNDCFNTGIKRKAHQSTCGTVKKPKANLMDLFHVKILNLPNSKDHEGVLNDHKHQITQTLKYLITTGLEFYLGAQVKMLKQINGDIVNVYFSTSATILLKSSNIQCTASYQHVS